MSQFQAPFRRVTTGPNTRYYCDAADRRIPGVTTILNEGVPKKGLMEWGPRVTAEYAVDNWTTLTDLPPSQRLATLTRARWETSDRGAKRGTDLHHIAEKLITGAAVEVPDALAGYVEAYARFLDEWEPEPILVETPVCSYKHGYCGTLDAIYYVPSRGTRVLVDIKTGKSGIWGETALQLAAYRYAEVILGEGPVPEVDEVVGIHVTPEEAHFHPITAGPSEFRTFLYAQQMAEFCGRSRDLIGDPIPPPHRYPLRRLERVEEPV
jgi:hypothetical protein